MKYLELFFWGLGIFFLTSDAVAVAVADEKNLSLDTDGGAIYQANNKFKCPFVFGSFPDPHDCAHFYVCVAGIGVRKKCPFLQHFCILRRRCMPILVAVCGSDKTKTTTTPSTTTTESTKIGNNFKCPQFMGIFPHPNDCSKYYSCMLYVATLKTCPEKQLFHTGKSSCKPENEVDCGTRQKPGSTTIVIPTEHIVTEISETNSIEEVTTESITEDINTKEIITESTTEEISTKEVITESTIEVTPTTKFRPTGPPDHTCEEDDVDCIITETGDIEDWFICPRDIGSFPHPSSDKLFIFCMNWIPSVKKCGLNLVFSKELSTCIAITYF